MLGWRFLSWLMSQGHGLDKIAQTMTSLRDTGTLAQLFANLTEQPASQAFPEFLAAIRNLPNGVTNDDPFGGASQPAQLAHLCSLDGRAGREGFRRDPRGRGCGEASQPHCRKNGEKSWDCARG